MRRRRRENNKIVEEGIITLRRENNVLFDYFNRFLSNRCVFDSFCF